ncbi:MAG TPA: hypothetical protein VJM15_10275 [Sphingomicrobium sp.]|nr:hypothetical protein [Sphingomicrobium sp.]
MTSFWHKAARQSQARCDAIQSEIRAEPAERRSIRRDSPPSAALESTEDLLSLRLAEELEYARRMLEAMGDELSSDRLLLSRHVTALQSIDVVGQVLGHVATVIRASDPRGAVERIGMNELKARLKRTRID